MSGKKLKNKYESILSKIKGKWPKLVDNEEDELICILNEINENPKNFRRNNLESHNTLKDNLPFQTH